MRRRVSRLLHLAPESLARTIERAGIRGAPWLVSDGAPEPTRVERAVFALPVIEDFAVTFQWVRELRRCRRERVVGVYFTLPKDEEVLVGRYGAVHRRWPLSQATRWVRANPLGAELVVPRSIGRREVLDVRAVPQLVGWTKVAGNPPWLCTCAYCLSGEGPKQMRRVRAAFEQGMRRVRTARGDDAIADALSSLEGAYELAGARLPYEPLLRAAARGGPRTRWRALSMMRGARWADVGAHLERAARDEDASVRAGAAAQLLRVGGLVRAWAVAEGCGDDVVRALLDELSGACVPLPTLLEVLEAALRARPHVAPEVSACAREHLDRARSPKQRARLERLASL